MIKFMADEGERRDAILVYSVRSEADIAFRELFREAGDSLGMNTVFTLTRPSEGIRAWGGEKGHIDAAMLRRCVPDAADRICFVSGSPGFVAYVGKELRSLGVRRSRIRSDPFQGY